MSPRSSIPGQPHTRIFPDRALAGAAAARLVAQHLERRLAVADRCRVIFACAPSQDDFFRELRRIANADPGPWRRVDAFHMDDYVGLSAQHPQSFRHYLQRQLLDHVELGSFQPIQGEAPDPEAEARRYEELLGAAPIDLICLGIGENGHIAFNDPPVADFEDPRRVKVVEMDRDCRQQQVNDGCFPDIASVPRKAFSITLPVFSQAGMLSCVVPTRRKAKAVLDTVLGPVGKSCPASLLRTHPRSHLFLDAEAASLLPAELRGCLQARD